MSLAYFEIDQARHDYTSMRSDARRAFDDLLAKSWLYHDHMLEGVVLTESDITRALSARPCRNYCDRVVQDSLRRMKGRIDRMEEDAANGVELSLDWLAEAHQSLCDADDERAGVFRTRNTSPGVYHLDVIPAVEISEAFQAFIQRWESEWSKLHPIRAAALAHHEFMRVFPYDGRTGMVGRLMMNYILVKNFYPPAVIHANNRHYYFGALNGHSSDMVPILVEAIRGTIDAARFFEQRFISERSEQRRAAM